MSVAGLPAAAGFADAAAAAWADAGLLDGNVRTVPADGNVPLPAAWRQWVDGGFQPFRVKRHGLPVARARALRVAATALEAMLPDEYVPTLVGDRYLLSLTLPDAHDLRESVVTGGWADLAMVHRICLDSLRRFVAVEPGIRAAMTEAAAQPERFPLADRYSCALALFERIAGPTAAAALPTVLPALTRETGCRVLFVDPKPANFIGSSWPVHRTESAFRVDIDLLGYDSPLSLQIVLSVFAHPVVPPSVPAGNVFAALVEQTGEFAAEFDVGSGELAQVLLYHLLRNFTSAAARGSTVSKAQALAPVLSAALAQLPIAAGAEPAIAALGAWQERAARAGRP